MKRTYFFYILPAIISLFVRTTEANAQQPAGVNPVSIRVYDMMTDGDSVYVDFDVVFEQYRISTQSQALFMPVVSNKPGAVYELPALLIEGRKREKLNRRAATLKRHKVVWPELYGRITAKENRYSQVVRYTYTFPYESWMDDARLDMLINECGCDLSNDLEQHFIGTMPRPFTETFTFKPGIRFIMPGKEAKKERAESGTAYIVFPVAKHTILPSFANNASELHKIHESIAYIKGEPTTIIEGVSIRAYASPEGNDLSNLKLSQRRAEALRDYVQLNDQIPGNLIRAVGMGENWDGLSEQVEKDLSAPYRMEVISILQDVSIAEGRERKLMALHNGHPYRYLLQVHYPRLRRSDYEIKYTVPGFDPEKAKEVFKTRPGMLSLEEMFLIAQTYEKGSAPFNRVFETAAHLFPGDKVAALNAAASSLYKGDIGYAAEVLEGYAGDPDAWNNLGVLRLRQGRLDDAETIFYRALQHGDSEAAGNIAQLEQMREADTQKAPLRERAKSR